MGKSNAEIYIEKYKELEQAVRVAYKLNKEDSISYYLEKKDKFKFLSNEIHYCQEVRNLLQHMNKINDTFPIEPVNETIDFISSLIERVNNRKKCKDICVKFGDIHYRTINDSVKEAMKVMKENSYTCIPILDGKKVIGVFDENSLFEYLAEEKIVEIGDNLKFIDIQDYIGLYNREMEDFIFFASQKMVEDLELEFEKRFSKGKRLSAVFITPAGNENEDLVGLITAWDILGHKQ